MDGLLVKIDKYNHYLNIKSILHVSRGARRSVFLNLVKIIKLLLSREYIPDWFFWQIPFPVALYPSTHDKIQTQVDLLFPSVPEFLNIQNGFLAGGSICKFAFDKNWVSPDIDIFIKSDKHKRVKVYLDDDVTFLDLVFKNKSISDFDISVCQIGMELKTRRIYVTFLFLYSFLAKKLIVRVSAMTCDYETHGGTFRIQNRFYEHLIYHKDVHFHKCWQCQPDGEELGGGKELIFDWFQRINKYESRFPDFKIKFINSV